jgi:hypothetical protein
MFDTFTASSLAESMMSIFGNDGVYAPLTGDAVNCRVNVVKETALQPNGYDVQVFEVGTTIEGIVSEIGEPKIGSTFLINSTTYTVKKVESNDGVFVKVVVKES